MCFWKIVLCCILGENRKLQNNIYTVILFLYNKKVYMFIYVCISVLKKDMEGYARLLTLVASQGWDWRWRQLLAFCLYILYCLMYYSEHYKQLSDRWVDSWMERRKDRNNKKRRNRNYFIQNISDVYIFDLISFELWLVNPNKVIAAKPLHFNCSWVLTDKIF